jgi:membrane fusion protein (multidrug efflux system)
MRSAAWLSADTTFAPIRGPAAMPNSDPPRMRPENLLLLALLAAACAPPAPTGAMQFPPPEVTVTTVALQDIPIALDYLGKTEASREVEVRARVQGYLATRDFVEGAVVKAGDLLYTIDPKPLQAQAQVAKAEVAIAQARLEQAVREVARLAPLVGTEAVTKKDIDDAKSAEQIASASLQQAQAHLDQITLELGYTRVTAPFAGVTGRAVRYEGSLVEPGTNSLLTTLLQLDPIYVMFQRTENQQIALDRDLASGRIALPADGKLTVELQHRDGTVLASGGTINFVDGKLEALTGTIPPIPTCACALGKQSRSCCAAPCSRTQSRSRSAPSWSRRRARSRWSPSTRRAPPSLNRGPSKSASGSICPAPVRRHAVGSCARGSPRAIA